MKKVILFSLLMCLPTHTLAQSAAIEGLSFQTKVRVLTNVADDFAQCSTYYQIVSECMNNTVKGSGDNVNSLSLEVMYLSAMALIMTNSLTLSEAGKEVDKEKVSGTSAQTVVSWISRYKQEMQDEIQTGYRR